ncbi:ATP synthase gamma chain [Caldithrix abyssi DSM 13497]|uniref:ATP synthase gamma chain n=1 Tax=Caldithrix abyssi DSM 13497 TaxID=880073 RepID=H1XNU1_CALAY|nr:ATP synthase F1 subunit gamma [Caldithrix abyssi]APF19776.1 atpG ATP synthase F1 subcomplex gamma subunit [Caldithrix abyssi DSM 13497]EHO39881.1 ATP synthase gamma chain [Caldithrix abyssi DSM 13497]
MANLREIRKRIASVRSTQQITKAMKMVAAAKLRKAQENIVAFRPYSYELRDLIAHLTALMGDKKEVPLMIHRPVQKVLLVVVTADRGLCGAFNHNIIRRAHERVQEYQDTEVELYLVGRKGLEYFRKRPVTINTSKINFFNDLNFHDAVEVTDTILRIYQEQRFDRVEFIYNEFKSAVQQNVIVEQFLPFVPDEEMVKSSEQVDFLYEPDKETILNAVIPRHLRVQTWRILLESNAAEQGARMTAMENATENAEEMVHQLTIFYNRSRQASITTEISEIVSGAEALKES